MRPPAVVAGGHAATVAAAVEVLSEGGNAFDAAIAGGCAAAVAEPALTSLAGGGFMTARTDGGQEFVADFFVTVPGLGAGVPFDPAGLEAVPVHFGGAVQDFHVGAASVAVPGTLSGYLRIHAEWGRIGLDRVVAPAVRLARGGIEIDRWQAHILGLLDPILGRNPEGRELFFDDGRRLGEGDVMVNPALGQFLEDLGRGDRQGFDAAELGGRVTNADLDAYEVVIREPLHTALGEASVALNPAPSFGGRLVAFAIEQLADAPALTGEDDPAAAIALCEALESLPAYRELLGEGASRGTTHLSVVDHDSNMVALTTSNGSCSGEFAGSLGVQLNNMMGESDLHPGGFGSLGPGSRIGSMMAPGILGLADRRVAFGSGGSERIRSTLTQMVARLGAGRPLDEAVEAPRVHWDGTTMQMEPGWSAAVVTAIARRWPVNLWDGRDLYFGGAHLAADDGEVGADPRRGGVAASVPAPA